MGQLFLLNPRRRKKASSKRRSKRASPAQVAARKRFAAMSRARAGSGVKRRRRHARRSVAVASAPRRSVRRSARRSVRRSQRGFARAGMPTFSNPFHAVLPAVKAAAIGGAGAIGVDLVCSRIIPMLPVSMQGRYDAAGAPNWGYYGVKLAVALGVGYAGAKFAPANLRGYVTQGVAGSLTVQGYEILRALMPADMALGIYTLSGQGPRPANRGVAMYPGRVVPMRPAQRLAGMGASFGAGSAGGGRVRASETRIGEGVVR